MCDIGLPFFFNDTATAVIYTLSLHDALPIYLLTGLRDLRAGGRVGPHHRARRLVAVDLLVVDRSEEHTSELQSPYDLVCRLLLEKKKKQRIQTSFPKQSLQKKYELLTLQIIK